MGVPLGDANRRVAEDFLDGPRVDTLLDEERARSVATVVHASVPYLGGS